MEIFIQPFVSQTKCVPDWTPLLEGDPGPLHFPLKWRGSISWLGLL